MYHISDIILRAMPFPEIPKGLQREEGEIEWIYLSLYLIIYLNILNCVFDEIIYSSTHITYSVVEKCNSFEKMVGLHVPFLKTTYPVGEFSILRFLGDHFCCLRFLVDHLLLFLLFFSC